MALKPFFTWTAALLLLPAAVAFADRIVVDSGDVLTGTVMRLEKGRLIFETDYAEPMVISQKSIRAITTDRALTIHLVTGEILKGSLETGPQKTLVSPGAGRERVAVDWMQIKAINPPPPTWKGNLTLGGNRQSGNTDRTSATIVFEGSKRGAMDRYTLRFLHNYAEEDDELTTRNSYGQLKYDYFFTKRTYAYLGVEGLSDKFKDLNLRTVVGPGLGYQVWEKERKSLGVEVGVAYYNEDNNVAEDDAWWTGRFAWDFRYRLGRDVAFSDNFVIYPFLEDSGRYQLRNEAAFTSPILSRLALKLTYIVEYDSDPDPTVEKGDYTTILGLQYSF